MALKGKKAQSNMPALGSLQRLGSEQTFGFFTKIYLFISLSSLTFIFFFQNFCLEIVTLIYIVIDTFCAQPSF